MMDLNDYQPNAIPNSRRSAKSHNHHHIKSGHSITMV